MSGAIIFDMDGVLLDTERIAIICWSRVAERNSVRGIEPVLYRCIGTTSRVTDIIMSDFFGGIDIYTELREQYYHERVSYLKEHGIPVKEGAKELLGYLSDRGILVGLASSTYTQNIVGELSDTGLLEYFTTIVGGEMVSKSKPDPDIFLFCADRLGCPPSEAYVIEDSFNGILAAHAAGMRAIMVPDLIPPDESIKPLLFALCCSLFEVKALLSSVL